MTDKSVDILDHEVVLSENDVDTIQNFFSHFEITLPEGLALSLSEFRKRPDLKTQKKLVMELTKALSTGKSSLTNLEAQKLLPVVKSCNKRYYSLQFDEEMDGLLSEKSTQASSEE